MGRVVATDLAERADATRTVELAGSVSSVPEARHIVRDDLVRRRVPPTVIDNALIVVTELVSNAILHAEPLSMAGSSAGVVLRWSVADHHVFVDVTDGGGDDLPQQKLAAPVETAGRGLAIVDAVASHWTVQVDAGQVTVHAVVGPWEAGR
ncbi:MAG TPA: ATP-binding protein [Jiangellaceae bacterium]